MEYTDEMKEMEDFLDTYSDEGYQGIVEAHGALEYAQFIEKLDFAQAKELMYRFIEKVLHPDW